MKLKDYLQTAEGELYIGGAVGWLCIGSSQECLDLIPQIYSNEKERLKTFIKKFANTESPNYQRQVQVARRLLKELKPLLDCKVLEVYEKETGTGVIINSPLRGSCWFKEEFEEWKKVNLKVDK